MSTLLAELAYGNIGLLCADRGLSRIMALTVCSYIFLESDLKQVELEADLAAQHFDVYIERNVLQSNWFLSAYV